MLKLRQSCFHIQLLYEIWCMVFLMRLHYYIFCCSRPLEKNLRPIFTFSKMGTIFHFMYFLCARSSTRGHGHGK